MVDESRSPWDPFRYIEPGVFWKALLGVALLVGSLLGVQHKAGVENAEAVNHAQASAAVAVYAAEMVDSLTVHVAMLERQVAILNRATPKDKLAQARLEMGKPGKPREKPKPWWRVF